MSHILISAGDYSADLHGESLVSEMRKMDASLFVTALGGIKLKGVSDEFLQDMVELDVSGFSQPVKQFFKLKKILQQIVFPRLDPRRLDAVILIDYYGFNIHIAEKAKERNIPVFYFVSPQVWASRQGRIQKLKKCVRQMLVIFPFEEELYRRHGVPVTFVGHPLMDRIPQLKNEKKFKLGAQNGPIRLGLLPGSRTRELARHIPLLIRSFEALKKKFPNLEGTLFAVEPISDEYYRSWNPPNPLAIVRENDYKKRSDLTLALTASGTATLENALLGIPMIVIYQTSWLTYFIARRMIRVPYISMPNILAGKAIVPELIQHRAEQKSVTQLAADFISHPESLEKMHRELLQLKESLGPPGAYQRAAKIILGSVGA